MLGDEQTVKLVRTDEANDEGMMPRREVLMVTMDDGVTKETKMDGWTRCKPATCATIRRGLVKTASDERSGTLGSQKLNKYRCDLLTLIASNAADALTTPDSNPFSSQRPTSGIIGRSNNGSFACSAAQHHRLAMIPFSNETRRACKM